MAAQQSRDRDPEVVEHGDIYFFYRPKVETDQAAGLEDVQRFHFVLRPHGRQLFRLITIGRKRLPDIGEHERTWSFIDMVADAAREIERALREQTYETKARGTRTRPAARPAGEGVYAFVRAGNKLFLAYQLELPRKPGEVQQELKIPPAGSFAISIKNPGGVDAAGCRAPQGRRGGLSQIFAARVSRSSLRDGEHQAPRLPRCGIRHSRSSPQP